MPCALLLAYLDDIVIVSPLGIAEVAYTIVQNTGAQRGWWYSVCHCATLTYQQPSSMMSSGRGRPHMAPSAALSWLSSSTPGFTPCVVPLLLYWAW